MKLITEYLADAEKFERFARSEHDPQLKSQLERQAAAYRKLAKERAKTLGLPPAPEPQSGS